MKKWLFIGFVALIILVIALPKFGERMGWDLTRVQATNKALVPAEADITTGESVYLQNSSGLSELIICLGHNGVCQKSAGGPGELQPPGLALHGSETREVQFNTTGSFPITSPQLHANALVVVTQSESNDSSSSDGSGGSNNSAGGNSSGGGDYNGGFGGSGGSNAGDNGTDDNNDGAGGSSGGGDDGGDG